MAFLEGVSRVHVIGAGGIGISAVAKLLRHDGRTVTGSDLGRSEAVEELERLGVPVARGHAAGNLPADADLVVYSDAVPADNPERAEASRRGLRQLSYFEFVGEYSRTKRTAAVSGTNGKSTTTALLGLLLEAGGLDPTVIVGSKVRSFADRNLRLGGGETFVVEACEYRANMLKTWPQMIVLTNIEEDHLDYYRDLAHIRETFQKFVDKLPAGGKLVFNADDPVTARELRLPAGAVSYGFAEGADYRCAGVTVGGGRQEFEVAKKGAPLARFSLSVPGRFNVYNALAAIAAASELGVPAAVIQKTVAAFPGIWRRFERVGEFRGAPVYSDYGHHPTALSGTLSAAREFFPGHRIVLCFQPHQHNRTRKLFDEFVASLDGADVAVIAEIFDVAGRESTEDAAVSSKDLVSAVSRRDAGRGVDRPVLYAASPEASFDALQDLVRPDDIVIVMGAGDIYKVAERLASDKTNQEL